MNSRLTRFTDDITRVTLAPPIKGFEDFICAWVMTGKETLVIDPGPSITSGDLLSALRKLDIQQPDYILLTHIHIDHAGGIGEIAAAFPRTPVVCHETALPHLADPEKLWRGTVKTLGETGRAYGPISPVSPDQLIDNRNFSSATIRPISTPGHAPHHISFITPDRTLFAGETGGVCLDFTTGQLYLRPATPPRFSLDISIASIDRLLAEEPETICYGHAAFKTAPAGLLQTHKEQLFLWQDIIKNEIARGPEQAADRFLENIFVTRCADMLIKTDPLLQPLAAVASSVYRRERFFIENSVRGFVGSLAGS